MKDNPKVAAETHRTATHVFTRELDRLVHQGHLRSYRVHSPAGKRRFVLVWSDGSIQDVGAMTLDSLLQTLARKGEL